jgi:hypothetical protein
MELRKINLKDAVDQWEYTTALPEEFIKSKKFGFTRSRKRIIFLVN